MAQVKFYSKANLPSKASDDGVYFINGGELYKGSQRFGLGRVTVASTTEGITGMERGDIVVTGAGAGWVFDGEHWQSIGGDIGSLQSSWQADIKTWTAGLAVGGSGSYITGITKDADGKVTASAEAFPDLTFASGDAAGQVKLGSTNATVNGWGALVSSVSDNAGEIASLGSRVDTLESKVSDIEEIVDVTTGTVTASTGSFTNLTVADTATFSATVVSAGSLKVGGSTVEQLADKQIAAISAITVGSTATGITVSVTTQGGSVTAVSLNAESFTNVMHFLGVGTVTKDAQTGVITVVPPSGKTPVAGDIVIDSTSGLEAICTSATTGDSPTYTWELIGDNAVYALNAYNSSASVYSGVTTVPGALNAAGAEIDALKIKTDAYAGGSSTGSWKPTGSAANDVISTTVGINTSTMAPTVSMSVNVAELKSALDLGAAAYRDVSNTVIDTSSTALVTEGAVATALAWITD